MVSRKRAVPRKRVTALLVRVEGFEPSRRKTPDPKSGASAVPPHSHAEFYCNTAVFTESNYTSR